MPNQIDNAPLQTPVKVGRGVIEFLAQTAWAKWFNQIVDALNRPTITELVTFPLTASGQYSTHIFQFPANTITVNDFPIVSSLLPPVGTAFTAHMLPGDQVGVCFHNYSGVAQAILLPQSMSVTVLRQ